MIYAYCRVSSTKQIDGLSLSLQDDKELLSTIAKDYNTELSERVYIDSGFSAYKGKNLKNELGILLTDIEHKVIKPNDIIVMRHLDRLSRQELGKSLDIFNKIMNSGVKIHTTLDGRLYDNTDSNRLTSQILAALSFNLANEESLKKSYLTNRAALYRIEQFLNGERDKSGYSYDIVVGGVPFHIKIRNKAVYPHPQHFEKAQDLVQFALKGNGFSGCQKYLKNTHKITLTKTGIANFLTSPALYGCNVVNLQDHDAIALHKANYAEDKKITKQYILDGYYPPLCTEKEFRTLQGQFKSRRTSEGNRKSHTLLAGVKRLFCGDCGNSLTATTAQLKNKTGPVYYNCISSNCKTSQKIYTVDNIVLKALSVHFLKNVEHDDSIILSLKVELKEKAQQYSKMQTMILDHEELFNDTAKIKLKTLKSEVEKLKLNLAIEQDKLLNLQSNTLTMQDARVWNEKREYILTSDSETKLEYKNKIVKLVNKITVKNDGLHTIETIDGAKTYFYIPEQPKNTGRRMGVELAVPKKPNMLRQIKQDPVLKKITFSETEILNGDYRHNILDIHPTLLTLYSEESTRYLAIDHLINSILEECESKGYFIFTKKNALAELQFTDKQWQSHKTKIKRQLIAMKFLYSLKFITKLENSSNTLVVCQTIIKGQLNNIKANLQSKEITDYILVVDG